MTPLLVGTTNLHKLEEYRELLAGLPFRLFGLRDVAIIEDVDETGETFEENARLKADRYAELSGLLTLADDSGLEVDALAGQPGVHS
ncbi:MAG: non-canonical purine NTP pyrophosphatase, partial [Chloroflexota bacterium]